MHPPEPLTISAIDTISPIVYEAALQCLARASWVASGDRSALPPNPRSILGIGVHEVLERGACSGFPGTTEEQRAEEAAEHFDEEMKGLFQSAHPLVRAKFGNQERIPFYYLYRARVVSGLSKDWLQVEQTSLPKPGQTVRLTNARRTNNTAPPTEFRADRATRAVWKV